MVCVPVPSDTVHSETNAVGEVMASSRAFSTGRWPGRLSHPKWICLVDWPCMCKDQAGCRPVDLESSLENDNKHVCGCAYMLLAEGLSEDGPILVNVASEEALNKMSPYC